MAITAQQRKQIIEEMRARQAVAPQEFVSDVGADQARGMQFKSEQEQALRNKEANDRVQTEEMKALQDADRLRGNDFAQQQAQTARATENAATLRGRYGEAADPESIQMTERTRLAQENQPKGPVSAPPPNPAKPGLGRLKPGLFSSQDNAKQEVPTLSEMINPNLSRFQKSGGTQGVVGLTDTQSTEQQPVKPPLDVPAGEPSLRPEPPSQVPGTTGVPASSKEKVTAAIKEKQQKATLPATTDVKNPKKPFNIDPWLRFGSDIFGATAGRGTGRVDKFIDERNEADPTSPISRQWQKRAAMEEPGVDWSGVPAKVIKDKFPVAEKPNHSLTFEQRKELAMLGKSDKGAPTWGTMRLGLQDYGKRSEEVIPLEFTTQRLSEAFGGLDDVAKVANLIPKMSIGAGRFKATIDKPGVTMSPQEKKIAAAIQEAKNVVLKTRSGAAVTNQEFLRLRSEAEAPGFAASSPEVLADWLRRFGVMSKQLRENLDASVQPETLAEYRKNQATNSATPAAQGNNPSAMSQIQMNEIATQYFNKNQNIKKIDHVSGDTYRIAMKDGSTKEMKIGEMK